MRAKIVEKQMIAEDTLMITLDLMGETIDFKPGQFFYIDLIDAPYKDAKGNRRDFSIINSPHENDKIVFATRIRDTAFKNAIDEYPLGTEVEVSAITGDLYLDDTQERPLVLIAGGMGINPFMSMLHYIKHQGFENDIILLYSNRTQRLTPFLSDLQEMEATLPNLTIVPTMTRDDEWDGESQRIDAEFIQRYVDNLEAYDYMIVGPPYMVEGVYDELLSLDIPKDHIFTENFGGY